MTLSLVVSKGNTKLGAIPNSSLVPIKDCVNCRECKQLCYARKAYARWPNVKHAWDNNSKLLRSNRNEWEAQHISFLHSHNPQFFRFNVAGDIISDAHLKSIINIANSCPSVSFLLFSKNYNCFLNIKHLPSNLKVKLSVWGKMGVPPKKLDKFSRAYTEGCKVTSRYKKATQCSGSCSTCKHCFTNNEDVKFKIH